MPGNSDGPYGLPTRESKPGENETHPGEQPGKGYQLFRWAKRKADGSVAILPNDYVGHLGKSASTKTGRLKDAKAAVGKMAGEDAQAKRRLTAKPAAVTVNTLLNLVADDYVRNEHNSMRAAKARINRGSAFFGEFAGRESRQ